MAGVDFDELAAELYRLPPAEFTGARDRRVKEARATGNRDLAESIGRLRRPTGGAWLANLLVREQLEQIEQLVELGAAMREAQQALAGEQLVLLSRQRQQVVSALSRDARRRAAEVGQPATAAAGLELEETLRAALADPAAADQLLTGRLAAALHPVAGGFDLTAGGLAVTAGSEVRGGAAGRAVGKAASKVAGKPAAGGPDAARAKLAADRAAADAAIRRAAGEIEEAEREAAAARDAEQRQEAEAADLQRRLGELEAELNRVRAEESLCRREVRRAKTHAEAAQRQADAAKQRLSDVQERRNRLAGP